ncbi:MAG: hypothetical protein JNK53_04255, partial [Phycisphaerae bacterium]|nr:hypothetical protein [Phycisphaerae bacterium]
MPHSLQLEFRSIAEPVPGRAMVELFAEHWPAYRRWIGRCTQEGPSAAECVAQLQVHMPELMPTFWQIVASVGDTPDHLRFLSLYLPPAIIRGCSQAVCGPAGSAVLVRNYDHAPHLCDGIVLSSAWAGVRVHAMTDCLWGALDGVNEHGLAVALAFGGRQGTGPGFSASLVARYVLQTCATVAQAWQVLQRVPVYMAYNFTLLDRNGAHMTVYTGPDRPASFDVNAVSTNHQGEIEWPAYARFSRTRERQIHLERLHPRRMSVPQVVQAFLRPPLYRREFRRGAGTLY